MHIENTPSYVVSILAGLAAAVSWVDVAPAHADPLESVVYDLLQCDAVDLPAERLACFERLSRQQKARLGLLSDGTAVEADETETLRGGEGSAVAAMTESQDRVGPASVATGFGSTFDDTAGEALRKRISDTYADERRKANRTPLEWAASRTPFETTVIAFQSNRSGDFRFRIAEGLVFEWAGGPRLEVPGFRKQAVEISRNSLGQWRLRIPGQTELLWVRPIEP